MRVRTSAGASEEAGTARLVVRPSFGEVRCAGRGVQQRRWFGRSPWVLLRACTEVEKMTCIAAPNAPHEPYGSHTRTGASNTAPSVGISPPHSRATHVTSNGHRHDKTRRCAGVDRPRSIGSMRPFASTHRLLHYGAKKERLPLIHAAQKPLLSRTHPGPALVQRQHTRDSEVFSLRQPAREAPAAMSEGPRPTRCVVTTTAAVRRPRCSCHALLATATMLPSAARAARRRSTSRARGERVNDVKMGSTKLHRVRSGQRHTRRSGGRWLGERRFARWRPNLGGHVSSLAAYPCKRSTTCSSPDPYSTTRLEQLGTSG